MIWILIVKIFLVIYSIISLGIVPLLALLNLWIWNEVIVGNVFACAVSIKSFWIVLGLTATGAFPIIFGFWKTINISNFFKK